MLSFARGLRTAEPTAVTTSSERLAIVEAKAAAISSLGVQIHSALEGAAATVGAQSFALGQLRAGHVAWLTRRRLRLRKNAERRRRAGDLLRRRARGRRRAVGEAQRLATNRLCSLAAS